MVLYQRDRRRPVRDRRDEVPHRVIADHVAVLARPSARLRTELGAFFAVEPEADECAHGGAELLGFVDGEVAVGAPLPSGIVFLTASTSIGGSVALAHLANSSDLAGELRVVETDHEELHWSSVIFGPSSTCSGATGGQDLRQGLELPG
jgi:hypothetical protein